MKRNSAANVIAFPGVELPKALPHRVKKSAKKPYRAKAYKKKDVVAFNAFGHLMIGTAIGMGLANSPVEFALVLFGSLLPDIDHRNSTLGKWNPFTRWMTHRGRCHSLIGAGLLSSPFLFLGGPIPFGMVLLGAVGHILGDRAIAVLPGKQKFRLKVW